MAKYDRDYSVTEIKSMIAISEAKPHPFNPPHKGHAFSLHHGISDSDLIAKNKSAFIISADTNSYLDTLDPADLLNGGMDLARRQALRIRARTVFDQPFMVAAILNSPFGQAALRLLNVAMGARVTIHAKPMNSPMGSFRMRQNVGGAVDSSGAVQHVVIIIDNGGRDAGKDYLHFVTAYPTNSPTYKFKFSPQANFPQTHPGVEFYTDNGRKSLYRWQSENQSADSSLQLLFTA
ncbi:hypothetical protein [Rhodospirillaceae bacterium SYSU D60014]|uniref:hypothetical protein n=1 Tax=Virgifigura deserti TaxID=2268457 RepID=UPI000E65ED95